MCPEAGPPSPKIPAQPVDAGLPRIWLCADDYGISASVDAAIRDLIGRGRINATSVMVVAPSFGSPQALALAALNAEGRRAAIGLHFTLTGSFRPLSQGYGPLREGTFLPLEATLLASLLRRLEPERIAREVGAQLDAFEAAFGRSPDFIDGHHHVQVFPQVRDAVLDVAKARLPGAWLRQCGRGAAPARPTDLKGRLLDQLSRGFSRRARRLGLRINPAFAGTYDWKSGGDFTTLFPAFLDGLPDGSVVMCHPGLVDDELRRLDPLSTGREAEYRFLLGDAFFTTLAAKRVTLA